MGERCWGNFVEDEGEGTFRWIRKDGTQFEEEWEDGFKVKTTEYTNEIDYSGT